MKYTLTQEAYLTTYSRGGVYFDALYAAAALDENGEEATIYWIPCDDWKEEEDESDVCNWDLPDFIESENLEPDYWGVLTTWRSEDMVIF